MTNISFADLAMRENTSIFGQAVSPCRLHIAKFNQNVVLYNPKFHIISIGVSSVSDERLAAFGVHIAFLFHLLGTQIAFLCRVPQSSR